MQKETVNKKHINKILNCLGFILSIFGLLFLGFKFSGYWHSISFSKFSFSFFLVLSFLTLFYFVINTILAVAWKKILGYYGNAKISYKLAYKLYGISQIAKYVPGNIFQFVGRQAIGQSYNIPKWPLAKSVFWELVLICSAGGCFVAFTLGNYLNLLTSISLFIFLLTVITLIFLVKKICNNYFAFSFVLYLVFLFFSGLIFALTVYALPDANMVFTKLITVISAYIAAWLIGLITPGAPAGLGIREFVLIFLLKGMFNEQDILLAVLFGRLINTSADFLFYILALSIKNRKTAW